MCHNACDTVGTTGRVVIFNQLHFAQVKSSIFHTVPPPLLYALEDRGLFNVRVFNRRIGKAKHET